MSAIMKIILLSLFLSVVIASKNKQTSCFRTRQTIIVPYEGCHDATIKVPVCSGLVKSSHTFTAISKTHFSERSYSCCSATNYRLRIRRILFICDGVAKLKKVHIPIAGKCAQEDLYRQAKEIVRTQN